MVESVKHMITAVQSVGQAHLSERFVLTASLVPWLPAGG